MDDETIELSNIKLTIVIIKSINEFVTKHSHSFEVKMILHDEAYYERRKPIEDLGPLKNFKRFIWDPKRRAFLDRTAKDWAFVGLFYFCFFGILFSLFALQLYITLHVVANSDRPLIQRQTNLDVIEDRSFLKHPFTRFNTPGLGMIPNLPLSTQSPIILLDRAHDEDHSEKYIAEITSFLNDYQRNISHYDLKCEREFTLDNSKTKPCYFDIKSLDKCSQLPYGYHRPYKPCVYVKFNRRFDWIPISYNRTSELPENMPEDLKNTIKASEKPHVWLSCDGVNNFDKEHIGMIEYLPERGFPIHFFPFTGHTEYLSPIVALVFKNLTAERFVTVACYTWAENISPDERTTFDFQIYID